MKALAQVHMVRDDAGTRPSGNDALGVLVIKDTFEPICCAVFAARKDLITLYIISAHKITWEGMARPSFSSSGI